MGMKLGFAGSESIRSGAWLFRNFLYRAVNVGNLTDWLFWVAILYLNMLKTAIWIMIYTKILFKNLERDIET
jgi:hypothetical protein